MPDHNRGNWISGGEPGITQGVHPSRTQLVAGHDESGVTLVELLVAIVIMGVLFAGVAGALINFSKAAVGNERRVQSSNYLNSSQEQLQTIDWDLAVLYKEEVEEVEATLTNLELQGDNSGFVNDEGTMEFDGEELVLEDLPDDLDADEREEMLVPRPYVTDDDMDGEFEVFTFVTWADDIGDGTRAKRFTTIVRWTVFNQTLQQRFQSFRAPTSADIEATEELRVTQFNLAPSQIVIELDDNELDGDGETGDEVPIATGRTKDTASVSVRFNRAATDVKIGYFPHGVEPAEPGETVSSDDGGLVFLTVVEDPTTFTAPGGFLRFRASLPAGSGPFEDKPEVGVPLYVWGSPASASGGGVKDKLTMTFTSDDQGTRPRVEGEGEDGDDPGPTVTPLTGVNVRNVGGQDQLCDDVVLSAKVFDLEPDGYVLARFNGIGGSTGVGLSPPMGWNGEVATFTRTFEKGSKSRWDPGPGNNATDTVTFLVQAVNPGNQESGQAEVSLTVRRVTGSQSC